MAARAAFRRWARRQDVRRILFLDEFGLNLAMTRRYGRAPRGQRVIGKVPVNDGHNLTLVCTFGLRGLCAPRLLRGAMTGPRFVRYDTSDLAPHLRRGDIVVFDNLGAHRVVGAREAIEARGASVVLLPPVLSGSITRGDVRFQAQEAGSTSVTHDRHGKTWRGRPSSWQGKRMAHDPLLHRGT